MRFNTDVSLVITELTEKSREGVVITPFSIHVSKNIFARRGLIQMYSWSHQQNVLTEKSFSVKFVNQKEECNFNFIAHTTYKADFIEKLFLTLL